VDAETRIVIEGQLELGDYLRANYWWLLHRFKALWLLFIFAGVVYPVLYFSGISGNSSRAAGQSNWGFLMIPGLVLLMLIGTYWGTRRNLKSNKALQQRVHYNFTEQGIDVKGPISQGQSSWEMVRKAYETRSGFLLFISTNQMYILPKRYFQSDRIVEEFRELLRAELGREARVKRG